jgi:hypothetical protein
MTTGPVISYGTLPFRNHQGEIGDIRIQFLKANDIEEDYRIGFLFPILRGGSF